MDTFQAVRATIREDLTVQQLPPFLDQTVALLSQAHVYYRSYKQLYFFNQASQDPLEGNPAVYGAALHLIGDYTSIGAYAIQVALITKCTEDLLREYRQLSENHQALRQAFRWQYPLYQAVEWKKETAHPSLWLSPSLSLVYQVQIIRWTRQIIRINQCMLQVFWQIFKLSMVLCDIYLLLNGDSQARYEACTELVAEWERYKAQLKEDRDLLLEEIKKGSALADRVLYHTGITQDSSFIVSHLIQKVEKLVEDNKEVLNEMHDVALQTVDTVYVKGKITPLSINLWEGKAIPPFLPSGRFAPWAGQKVRLINLLPSDASLQTSENNFLQKIDASLGVAATALNQFYKTKLVDNPRSSPFV